MKQLNNQQIPLENKKQIGDKSIKDIQDAGVKYKDKIMNTYIVSESVWYNNLQELINDYEKNAKGKTPQYLYKVLPKYNNNYNGCQVCKQKMVTPNKPNSYKKVYLVNNTYIGKIHAL